MGTWGVTVTDVLNMTGTSATVAQVTAADSVITIYVNRTPDASASISPRDLNCIRTAIIWQTPWQATAADYTSRSQFDSMSQDGFAVSSTAQWAKLLSPVAARSLKNLSWKASGTKRTPSVDVPTGLGLDFELESSDRYTDWYTG